MLGQIAGDQPARAVYDLRSPFVYTELVCYGHIDGVPAIVCAANEGAPNCILRLYDNINRKFVQVAEGKVGYELVEWALARREFVACFAAAK